MVLVCPALGTDTGVERIDTTVHKLVGDPG